MFASAAYSNAPKGQIGAYRQVQIETGVDGASPSKLVSMLFDGLAEAVTLARSAMRNKKFEAKGKAIGRAVRIVDEGLKATLNMQDGGTLALDLRDLYAYMTLRLTQANLHNDEAALEECGQLIEPLRNAWSQLAGRPAP